MKIVFFGTPEYVLPILNSLQKISAVVTQPPKPAGRKKIPTRSAVDKWARKRKIKVFYNPKSLLRERNLELGVLAAYGNIISEAVISNFKFGIVNIHPSLLPKYRGASPVQSAIANGDTVTGVSIVKLTKNLDAGPILFRITEKITSDDTAEALTKRLFKKSAEMLVEMLSKYLDGKITPKLQDEAKATYTKVLTREDGYIDLTRATLVMLERKIRAYYPWPGVWARLKNGKRLKFLPNNMVQLEGKNPVTWDAFKKSYSEVKLF